MIFFEDYRDVPKEYWPFVYFKPYEIACKGTGNILINYSALTKLDELRRIINKPIRINSAYRSPIYNAKIGGAPLSRHKFGDAFDINLHNQNLNILYKLVIEVGFSGFGFYNSFLHVDTFAPRTWDLRTK